MDPKGLLQSQIDNLQRQLDELTRRVAQNRTPATASFSPPRLAITTGDGSGYPTEPADTYPIVFLNGTFTEASGDQSPTYTNRKTGTAVHYAHWVSDDDAPYLATGTKVWVTRQDKRWWILSAESAASGGKTKVRSTDVLDYLDQQFADVNGSAQYDSAEDLKVEFDVEGSAGSEKLRAFIDADAIAGYSESVQQALTHDSDGTLRWVNISAC